MHDHGQSINTGLVQQTKECGHNQVMIMKQLLCKQTARGQGSDQADGSDETSDNQQPNFHVVDFVESAPRYAALSK